MYKFNDVKTKIFRRGLRSNSTRTEVILWQYLKGHQLGVKFRRQYGIGQYILDFYCPSLRLAIEVDGDVHAFEKNIANDRAKESLLYKRNVSLIRVTNVEILENIEGVIEHILQKINAIPHHTSPKLGED